ncbi:MAG: insulinase family protein [bacterium]|nr:insulinase family protein [bacterium]
MRNIDDIKIFKLDNGLQVFFYPMNNLPITNVNLWANVGSVNEKLKVNGISHFLEHMLFKDTKKYANNSLTKEIEDFAGGYMNAATSFDYTHYYATLHKNYIEKAFDVLSNMAFNLDIEQNNLDLERGVITEEIQRGEDNPWNVLWQELYKHYFKGHNYANPIIGNKKNILNISRDDLHYYYDKFYYPANLSLVIAGDTSTEKVLALSNKYFNINKKVQTYETVDYHPHKLLAKEYHVKKMPSVSQTYFAYAYNASFHPAIYLLDIMLGGGISSIFYKRLKQDERLVWSIGTDFSHHKYGATFIVYGVCEYSNLPAIDKILQEKFILTEEDLNKAKRIFKMQHDLEHETISGITDSLGYYAVLSNWKDAIEIKKQVLSSMLEDVKAIVFEQSHFIRQIVKN